MANNYSELAAFMRDNKSNPLALAKVMTGWIWTSLLPAGAGPEPTDAKSVPLVMNASCGWRDILLESLFEGIGIEHRRVNFYDVPFQSNHTATELFINGKWMFFDSTFGIYFTRKGSTVPLSMEEARSLWPDVTIQQSSLAGWQGVFADPDKISAKAYRPTTDTFAFSPSNYSGATNVVAGELYALYFVKKATYLGDDGKEALIPGDDRTWTILTDSANAKTWRKYTYFYDTKGRADAQYVLLDDKSHLFVHRDLDDKYAWARKTTNVTADSRLERVITDYDDKSKDVRLEDAKSSEKWTNVFDHYGSNRRIDYSIVKYDDGTTLETEHDDTLSFAWSSYTDSYSVSGELLNTTLVYDDGSVKSFDWAVAQRIAGTSGDDNLAGTDSDDALFGMSGNDVLNGGAGIDRMEGGTGNDVYYADSVSDIVVEKPGGGIDTVIAYENFILARNVENLVLEGNAVYGTGQELNNWIVGNAVGNVITGGAGNDRLLGHAGADLLIGGDGKDTLEGGLDTDTLYGGTDADVFLWRTLAEVGSWSNDADLVRDFSRAQGDLLSFKLIDADQTKAGNQTFSFIGNMGFSAPGQLRYVHSGSDTLIYLNTDADTSGEAVLRLAGKHTPDASWFVF